MTSPTSPSELLRFGLFRLLQAVGLAISVVGLLFVILESGIAGDPAVRMVGEHSSPERLANARLQLGYFKTWSADAIFLDLEGPPARFYLDFPDPQTLVVQDLKRTELQRLDLTDLDCNQLVTALQQLDFSSAGHRIQAALGDPPIAEHVIGSSSADGVGYALHGVSIPLQSNRTASLSWALPRSAWSRFIEQTGSLLLFNFGRSADGQDIGAELRSRGARSLALTIPAFILGTLLAIGAALWFGAGRWGQRIALLCVAGMAVSSLAWILLLRNVFAARLGWFPVAGWQEPYWQHLALPVLTWVLLFFLPSYLVFRQLFSGNRAHDHYLIARAKGASGWALVWNHVARPSSAPVVAQLVLALPHLVLGSLLLERIFVIPGLGNYTIDAALSGDASVLRATTFVIALLYIASQWLGDWLTAALDPRFRRRRTHG